MMVWQGSCQGRCTWRRSRGATAKGFAIKKLSSADFCFISRGSCESEVFRFLFQGKARDNPLRNVLKEAEYVS
jgi:hypothetical protein